MQLCKSANLIKDGRWKLVAQELVCALISSGMPVRNISMASNHIGDSGIATLSRLLDDEPGYSCVLTSLDLRGNNIASKGCKVRCIVIVDFR